MLYKKKGDSFSHLHVHTQYSLLDGAIKLDALFKKVKYYGMNSIAITDHGSMFGVFDFYQKAINVGIKPILGCEFYIAPRTAKHKTPKDRKHNHIVLLAENNKGYKNLCKLASFAHLEGFYYKPRIDKIIIAEHNEGIICLSACLLGEIAQCLVHENYDKAKQVALEYLDLFSEDNFFLEIQNNGSDIQKKVNKGLIEISKELAIPLVATNNCHYLESTDFKMHKILSCIRLNKTINDLDKLSFGNDQLYVKSPQEMREQFSSCIEAIDNTIHIAKRCNVDLGFKKYYLPVYNTSSDENVDTIFEKNAREGYLIRLAYIKSRKNSEFNQKMYDDRLDYEIEIIKKMKFSSYFLIVADFILFAKLHQIAVGPGRGSIPGSLVAYSLGITDLDPIEHGLIFERFLNPSRISMPDIDVDFCVNGRDKVYKYLSIKYGNCRNIAQIITFGRMNAKMVIRDVGRALAIPLKEVDSVAKLIPNRIGTTIRSAMKTSTSLKKILKDENLSELIKISKSLEGSLRHSSIHAAGIVISDHSLIEHMPLCRGKNGEIITQFDMKGVEALGFVKFDLLGLKNLTIINDTIQMITAQERKISTLSFLDLTDTKTYKLLQQGNTRGIFQLESPGMKELLIKLKPQNFNEITALIALYRPGPLGSGVMNLFVERKHNKKKIKYIIPLLEPILKETYGIIVYQEQVMEIAVKIAGYSMSDTDSLIKAIGKKIPKLMTKHREKFINGACERKISNCKANELFSLIEKFGKYGFNKSHSAAYAVITYRTAYLKTNFFVEFMTALLTSNSNKIENVAKIIEECKAKNITILPPNINKSDKNFKIENGQIRFGLAAVKNVGSIAVDIIIKERQNNGEFLSIIDFFQRINLSKVNKRVIESLIHSGTFNSMKITCESLKSALESLLIYGHRFQKEKKEEQFGLFPRNKKIIFP